MVNPFQEVKLETVGENRNRECSYLDGEKMFCGAVSVCPFKEKCKETAQP